MEERAIVQVQQVSKFFDVSRGLLSRRGGQVRAVDGVSFDICSNETLGLVGESGCGKTTLGRLIVRLIKPSKGQILYKGTNIFDLRGEDSKRIRREIQMIFQDPLGSLNPRKTIGHSLKTPLLVHGLASRNEVEDRVVELLQQVGLSPDTLRRWPVQLSGGQQQRIVIARALLLQPELIVADEPISSADVSIQAQLINLLRRLQREYNLSMLFISHDLSMVRHISNRVAVMYLGKIVELANRDELYGNPLHPYTKALLSAVPVPKPALERKRERIILKGDVPSPANPPSGCYFHTRCPIMQRPICVEEEPGLRDVGEGHWVACHLVTFGE